ncbi:MAG: hypothetical protein LC803_09770 [Acidobacteria bacterium]|nr:hypothetical protein [Acidobacteriota bacterium]
MVQQTRAQEQTPVMNSSEIQLIPTVEQFGNNLRWQTLRCLQGALFCLTLSLTALAQGAATEVNTQVIPSAITVKCNQNKDDYKLVAVRATMPAQPNVGADTSAYALGVALVPAGKGEVRMFARYWFSFTGQSAAGQLLIKRDDDSGKPVSKSLPDFEETSFSQNVVKFFRDCTADQLSQSVFQALVQVNPKSSDEELANAFRGAGCELNPMAGTGRQQNIGRQLTPTDVDQVLFAQTVRALLLNQVGAQAPPAAVANLSPSATATPDRDEQSKLDGRLLEETKKSLEEAGKKVNSLSTLLTILLGVLVTALFLIVALVVLFYFNPKLQRKVFFHPEDATEIRRQAINALYAGFQKIGDPAPAQETLTEILNSYRQRFDGADGNLAAVKSAYQGLETELKKFGLSLAVDKNRDGDRNDGGEITSVRKFLSARFGFQLVKNDLMEGLSDLIVELNNNLLLLVGNDENGPTPILPRLKATRQHIETMWSKYSSEQCPEGALVILELEWEDFQNTLQPLKQIDSTRAQAYAEESVALFTYLREKFPQQTQKPGDLKSTVENFFADLETLQNKHLPADAQKSARVPADILTHLGTKLAAHKQAATELDNLKLHISALRKEFPSSEELPSSDGAPDDTIDRAIRMARDHNIVIDLLKDYCPADDCNNIIEAVNTVKKKIKDATHAVSSVLPKASGNIDEMVSGLVTEFNSKIELAKKAEAFRDEAEGLKTELEESQAQAKDSMELAGALSQYVNLSADKKLAPPQVRDILEQFNVGESAHRQLRLRLSAALPALDQALEEVRQAGRGDALDALRINDFKDQLRGLLTNIEDFTGDAMWKDCLSSGFSKQWLHNLFRAQLLAQTYFAEDEALARLVAPLAEAGAALRAAIRHFNVRVPCLSLLRKPPAGARVDYEVDPKLSKLSEVRRKVRATLRSAQGDFDNALDFIVDVESFPFQSDSTEDFGGRVVVVSPVEWS